MRPRPMSCCSAPAPTVSRTACSARSSPLDRRSGFRCPGRILVPGSGAGRPPTYLFRQGNLEPVGDRRAGWLVRVRVSQPRRRTEADRIAVGINVNALVLAPRGVFRFVDSDTGRTPLGGQRVGVIDPKVSRRLHYRPAGAWLAQMDLDAVAGGKAVVPSLVRSSLEAEQLVVGQRCLDVGDGKD